MRIEEWIKQAIAPEVAIAVGKSDREFMAEVLGSGSRNLRFLCDQAGSQIVASVANDQFGNIPKVERLTRLDKNLCAQVASDTILVVPFLSVGKFVISEAERIGKRADVITGYGAPEWFIANALIEGLKDLIEALARRGLCPILFHDPIGKHITISGFNISILPVGDTEEAIFENTVPQRQADELDQELDPNELPSTHDILDHARFLADTDLKEAVLLHDFDTMRSVQDRLCAFWHANLHRTAVEDEGQRELVDAATLKLREVAQALKSPSAGSARRHRQLFPADAAN